MSSKGVVLGIHALQTGSTERGIGRYVLEQARALFALAPELIRGVDFDEKVPLTPEARSLVDTIGRATTDAPAIYHVMSPIEHLRGLWPAWARGPETRLAATLYDLIPLAFSDRYIPAWHDRVSYLSHIELYSQANLVLAISEATKKDAEDLLGLSPDKVLNVLAGCTDTFRPAKGVPELSAPLARRFPNLKPGFYFCTGGCEYRKNLFALIQAYALLPESVREERSLVISCRLSPGWDERLRRTASEAGLPQHQLVLTDYIPDDELVSLYQASGIFVFPSIYEGFGLPVIEAMRSGIPALVGDNSSLKELQLDPEARFIAEVPRSIASVMLKAHTQPLWRQTLAKKGHAWAKGFTWEASARLVLQGYERLLHPVPKRARAPRRERVAIFSPMPPARSGIADYTARLVHSMADHVDVDVVTSAGWPHSNPPKRDRVRILGLSTYLQAATTHKYAGKLFCMGNSQFHTYAWRPLMDEGGDVLAHEIGLANLYASLQDCGEVSFDAKLRDFYGDRHADFSLDEPNWSQRATREGIRMSREILTAARRVFVHNAHAQRLAMGEGRSDARVIPFGHPALLPTMARDPATIACFGIVSELKRATTIVRAFEKLVQEHPEAKLVFVGRAHAHERELVTSLARELGLKQVTLTGDASDSEYQAYLRTATIAVQLREHSNGEMSAAVADCLAAGVPTIVSRTGGLGEIPAGVVVQVAPRASAEILAREMVALLQDAEARERRSREGQAYAAAHSFDVAAEALLEQILSAA